jgi:hypothetical protein
MPDKRHGPKSRLRLAIHHRAADLDIGQTGSLHAQLKVSHGLLELRKGELAIGFVDFDEPIPLRDECLQPCEWLS